MSTIVLYEITDSNMISIRDTQRRIETMGYSISEAMENLHRETLCMAHINGISFNGIHVQEHRSKLSEKSGFTVLSKKREKKLAENACKIVGIIKALSTESPELKPLKYAVDREFPEAQKISRELEQNLLSGRTGMLRTGTARINQTLRRVEKIVKNQHKILVREEQLSTASIFEKSLRDIGYSRIKRRTSEDGREIIRGSDSKNTSVFVEVDKGRIRVDTAGFKGRECQKAVEELKRKLDENGLRTSVIEKFHGKVDGGELVRETGYMFNPLIETKSRTHENGNRKRNYVMTRQRLLQKC